MEIAWMEIAVILVAIFASSLGSFYLGLFIGRHIEPTKQQAWLKNFNKDMKKLTDPEGGQHG